MAATVVLVEGNGVAGTPTADPANINFGSVDEAALTPEDHPIVAPANSFEKWLALAVTDFGGSSVVDNIRVYMSDTAFVTGETILANLKTTSYVPTTTYPGGGPVDTTSAIAIEPIPTAAPVGPNLGIGGALSGQMTSGGDTNTDYLVMQMQITAAAADGPVNQKTFTFCYDEM